MVEDFEHCYRAVQSRDPRFDGWFFTAVTTTGIFCRPSCPARTPHRSHVRFYPSAAAAHEAGFRACLRCRPDVAPGSPEWNTRADVAARAMRLVADGIVDREGVGGLARRLGYSPRQLQRLLLAEAGASPAAIARVQRAQTARVLIETTDLPMADVAFGAGFSSVRQFNDTVRELLGRSPTTLRRRCRHGSTENAPGGSHGAPAGARLSLRLACRRPMACEALLGFLGARAVEGVETFDGHVYARTLRLPHGHGVVSLEPADDHVVASLSLTDLRDLAVAVSRCRRLLDLDADPEAVDAALAEDALLRPLVGSTPGMRVPGAVDGFEIAVRAILGQQVSVAAARSVAAGLTAGLGEVLEPGLGTDPALARLFPDAAAICGASDEQLATSAVRRAALRALAQEVAGGSMLIDPGADPAVVADGLLGVRGIGPWSVAYVALRALGDPDAFAPGDLGVRRAVERLGRPGTPAAVLELASKWRPWRAYAMVHLWAFDSRVDAPRGTTEEAA